MGHVRSSPAHQGLKSYLVCLEIQSRVLGTAVYPYFIGLPVESVLFKIFTPAYLGEGVG